MSDELISVPEIASTHSRHRSVIHKIIKRLGFETRRIRSDDARGQEVLHITIDDYNLLIAELESKSDIDAAHEEATDWRGFLYIIQLEPKLDPGRFKIGFAATVEDRLRAHKTSAPFASLIRQWPCKLLWEKTAIESITRHCEKLHTEVFRTDAIQDVLERGDRFFEVMPKLGD